MGSTVTALKGLLRPAWASETRLIPAYERAFIRTLLDGHGEALAFGRGRIALWAILKAIGVDERSEVILPSYTCETVPMAVKFAGAKCVYADVAPGGYNVSVQEASALITERTKAIICQHTYGIVQPMHNWSCLAAADRIFLIEDRCQLIRNDLAEGGKHMLSDAAYFSSHFSKPFSTTQGGMAAFRESAVRAATERVRDAFPHDGDRRRARSLAIQTLLYRIAVRPTTRAVAGNVYRWAQRAGLIRGSISTEEYGRTMPADYLSRGTNLQAVLGMAQLETWERNRRHREQLTSFYLSRLERLGVDPRTLRLDGESPALLMVPVLVENKGQILRRAAGKGLPIGTWFDRPPAHIQEGSAPLYDYTPGQCPCTERLVSKEIHLLTGPWVRQTHANKAIRFLERHACLADSSGALTCVDPARADRRQSAIPASSQS